MDALSRIYDCLRADGMLLDIHPQPENSQIEIWQDGLIHRLGEIDQGEDHKEIEAAREYLRSFQRRGLFSTEQRATFELLEHHPSVESWQDRWAGEGYRLVAEPRLLHSATALLGSGGGELVIREPVRATSLRRLQAATAERV
ncbi:MAG: hypothetical protein WBM90_10395 [Acidimicrobiia bacterium]